MNKVIVDYDLLNKNAGTRAVLLGELVEKMQDLPAIRLAAERISSCYDRLAGIYHQLDDEAKAVIHPDVLRALSLINLSRGNLLTRSVALTQNEDTKDMFPETLILMRAAGTVIDLGFNYDAGTSNADDPVWIPPEGTNPRLEYSIEQGHWRCWDAQPHERTEFYTGHSPTSAYVAWRQGRQWVAEAVPAFPK